MVQYATPAEAGVKVGDFFVSSWGYDQTNIDFFKVVALTAKGIKVQKWQQARAAEQPGGTFQDAIVPGEGPMTYRVLPPTTTIQDPETGQYVEVFEDGALADYWEKNKREQRVPVKPEQKRLQAYGTKVYFKVNSFASASKWSGSPAMQTAPGYGH